MTSATAPRRELAPGTIFEVAERVGISIPNIAPKVSIRCPIHDDRHPSAFLSVRNTFFCSVCTSDGAWTARQFAQALGVPWPLDTYGSAPPRCRAASELPEPPPPTFTPEQAAETWRLALERTLDDTCIDADRDVFAYLEGRGLALSWEHRAFGILEDGMNLPSAISWWPSAGYRVVCPLYDLTGQLVNLQARSIRTAPPKGKKVLFPPGSVAKAAVFANDLGLRLLRGDPRDDPRVLLAEGLTDFLALTTTASFPVLSVPGTGFAVDAVGPWANDRVVIVALDHDDAGDGVVHLAADAAYDHGANLVVRVPWSPGCKDACDQLARFGPDQLVELLDHAPTEVSVVGP